MLNLPTVLLLIACVLLIFVWVQLVLASPAQLRLSFGSQLNSDPTFRLNVSDLFLSDQQHAEGQEAAEVRTVKPRRRAAVLQHQLDVDPRSRQKQTNNKEFSVLIFYLSALTSPSDENNVFDVHE